MAKTRGPRVFVQRWSGQSVVALAGNVVVWLSVPLLAMAPFLPGALRGNATMLQVLVGLAAVVPLALIVAPSRRRFAVYTQGFYPELGNFRRVITRGFSSWVPWSDVRSVDLNEFGWGGGSLVIRVSLWEVYNVRRSSRSNKDQEALVQALLSAWRAHGGKVGGFRDETASSEE